MGPDARARPRCHADRRAPGRVARLVLADLLPDVDRVVLLSLPAVASGDVAELADLDLGGHALAAATRPGTPRPAASASSTRAAARLGDRTAGGLRAAPHARTRATRSTSTRSPADVLVLDLERLRADGFTAQALAARARSSGSTSRGRCTTSPARTAPRCRQRWAVVPTRTPAHDAALLHWADRVKPWQKPLTPERDRWRRYAAAYARPGGASSGA